MAYQAKETLVNPIAAATITTVASVGTVGSVGQMGLEAEEAEPAESPSEFSADPEWAAELRRRQKTFEYLKQHHKRKKGERRGMTKAEMNAEVKRALDEDAKRQAIFQQQAMFRGVGIGYFKDENGKLIKRKAPKKRSVPRRAPVSGKAPAPRKAHVRASRTMSQEDLERIYRNRDQRHTRFWYARQLAAFIDGELKLSREQYHALLSFARMRGWNKKPAKR